MTRTEIDNAMICMRTVRDRIRARAKHGRAMANQQPYSDGIGKTYRDAAQRAEREADEIDDALRWMQREAESILSTPDGDAPNSASGEK